MKLYTVKQLARLAGVSVRALHHYDEIGLLKPASVGDNGYRYYGRDELLRLQQVLFYRELEFPLEAITAVLTQPDFDRVAALHRHREDLAAKASRYARLLKTLDDTLVSLKGMTPMEDKDLYKGFAPEKQAQYEAWLIERGGQRMAQRIEQAKQGRANWTKADWEQVKAETDANDAGMIAAMTAGLAPDNPQVTALMADRWALMGKMWNREVEPVAFKGLGQLYLDHPDFRARFEGLAPGLTQYLADAMAAYADGAVV